jgi:hypothetical protein
VLRFQFILTFALLLRIIASAQEISNLHFEQEGKMINVYYDLSGSDKYDIEVYCSQDGGTNWGIPLKQVTGEVGQGQTAGYNKKIIWNVFAEWDRIMGDIKFKIEAFPPKGCSKITVNHIAGKVAPVTKTVTYNTVTNIPGESAKCWIASNLGSDRQATSVSDATEASAGWYWQFNRKQGYKHDGTNRMPSTIWISRIKEDSNWEVANDPCSIEIGYEWRIPTKTEWQNVMNAGGWKNWSSRWNSGLKLHAAGYLGNSDGSLYFMGSSGTYWSSTQFGNSRGWFLYFYSSYCSVDFYDKAYGSSLRCLRD